MGQGENVAREQAERLEQNPNITTGEGI